VRRGCPSDPEGARNWISENIQISHRPTVLGERRGDPSVALNLQNQVDAGHYPTPPAGMRASAGHQPTSARAVPPPWASIAAEQLNGDGDFSTSLGRLRSLEKGLVAAIEAAMAQRNYSAIIVLRKELVAVTRGLYEGEIKGLTILKARSKLLSAEASRGFVSAILMPLAADLRALPSTAATPEARQALEGASEFLAARIREYVTRAGEHRGR
jgi:hypothetical protein